MSFGILGTGGMFTPQGSFTALQSLAGLGAQPQQPQQAQEYAPLPQNQTQVPASFTAGPSPVQQPPTNQIARGIEIANAPLNQGMNIDGFQVLRYGTGRNGQVQYSVSNPSMGRAQDDLDLAAALNAINGGWR